MERLKKGIEKDEKSIGKFARKEEQFITKKSTNLLKRQEKLLVLQGKDDEQVLDTITKDLQSDLQTATAELQLAEAEEEAARKV
jgi:5-methylcytosine-specific restriction endonuclease McrBC GTP-binding regulatory subunit McrB